MAESRVLHLVKDLIGSLESSASPEGHVDAISQLSFSTVSHQENVAFSKKCFHELSKNSTNPSKLHEKYKELNSNMDHVGPTVQLLSLIAGDSKLKDFLDRNARKTTPLTGRVSQSPSSSSIPSTSGMKIEDLPQFRRQLSEAVQESNNEMPVVNKGAPKSQHPNHRSPSMSDWYVKRPNLQTDFIIGSPTLSPFLATLAPIPAHAQTNAIMDDLLSVMAGVETDLIVSEHVGGPYETRTFTISDCIEPSVRQIVLNMLPVVSYFSITKYFIHEKSQFKFGQVNHALCSAMKTVVHEYMVHIEQLERMLVSDNLNLQKMWFYLQPTLTTMKILADIAVQISKSKAIGGQVLSLLHEVTASNSCNPTNHKLCLFLIQTASAPYMEILQKWVYNGVICDPYREFLVEDNEMIEKEKLIFDYSSDYWKKRYTICEERVPVFLERVAKVILRTGKYLNVIQQCGVDVKSPQADEIIYTVTERHYVEAIEKAYSFASLTLLDLLLKDYDLIGRLRSVKHYFLLDQGDFIVQLMDSCEAELSKNIDDIIPTRLESLLELVLRTSAANGDPYKDDMRTQLLPYDIYSQMFKIHSISTDKEKEYWQTPVAKTELTGIESFAFDYEVKWPVSLVLNRKQIACYQMIFRHLFYCKHVERSLCKVWICNKIAKTYIRSSSSTYSPAFTLRQRMLNCVQNLEYYMMVEVIEPNWVVFLGNMSKVKNIDDVLDRHNEFLHSCMKDCMLTSPSLLKTVSELMNVCIKYCQFIQSLSDAPSDSESIDDSRSGLTYQQKVDQFDLDFTAILVGLLNKISDLGRESNNEKLLSVLYRLDFNSYYSQKIAKLSRNTYKMEVDTSG